MMAPDKCQEEKVLKQIHNISFSTETLNSKVNFGCLKPNRHYNWNITKVGKSPEQKFH